MPRLLLVAVVLTALGAVGGVLAQAPPRRAEPPVASSVASSVPAADRVRAGTDPAALAVLHGWDERRAAAWSRGDAAALRALYVRGSLAGRRDREMLAAWTGRGLRVRGLQVQVLSASVGLHRRDRVVVTVTDRVADAVAVGAGVRRPLPRDAPSTRTVELVRVAGHWRVASVRPAAQPAG